MRVCMHLEGLQSNKNSLPSGYTVLLMNPFVIVSVVLLLHIADSRQSKLSFILATQYRNASLQSCGSVFSCTSVRTTVNTLNIPAKDSSGLRLQHMSIDMSALRLFVAQDVGGCLQRSQEGCCLPTQCESCTTIVNLQWLICRMLLV